MRDIVDDERRRYRPATAVSPSGCGRRRIVCEPTLLDDEPHRLRRGGSHPMRRRTQRHAPDLCRGSLAQLLPVHASRSSPARTRPACSCATSGWSTSGSRGLCRAGTSMTAGLPASSSAPSSMPESRSWSFLRERDDTRGRSSGARHVWPRRLHGASSGGWKPASPGLGFRRAPGVGTNGRPCGTSGSSLPPRPLGRVRRRVAVFAEADAEDGRAGEVERQRVVVAARDRVLLVRDRRLHDRAGRFQLASSATTRTQRARP